MKRKTTLLKNKQVFSNSLSLYFFALACCHGILTWCRTRDRFSPVKKRRYEQYSSEFCVFSHKSESVDSLGRGTVKGFMSCEIVCKLRLEMIHVIMALLI